MLPTPVMACNTEFTVTYMNKVGAKIVGKTQEECIGLKCYDLFRTHDCRTSNCAVDRCMKKKDICRSDTVANLPGGARDIRYTGQPLFDEEGEVIGGVEYIIDITEEVNAVKEVTGMVRDAKEGRLTSRGNPDAYTIVGFRDVIQGVNDTLDAIVEPINEIIEVMQKAAEKDLTSRMSKNYQGTFEKLKNDINSTLDTLDHSMQMVARAAEQVSSASTQIASGSQNLAEGANEQASSLEEISSSLEEMASMTKQNSENAQLARNQSSAARSSAERGNESIVKMSKAIDSIKKSANESAKILSTIDEIAFQTNLLALNAAVEAARAGDAGKGFAVVAEEVRSLARRSAEASKKTSGMIEESVRNSQYGVEMYQEVAAALEEISTGSDKVNSLIAEIAEAGKEQAIGIDQLNTAVAQLNQLTQQNAANAEESASTSEELSGQAAELSNMVAVFELGEIDVDELRVGGALSLQQNRRHSDYQFELSE